MRPLPERSCWRGILFAVVASALVTGCVESWRPSMESVREVTTPAPIDLTLYLPAVTPARRTFLRRDLRFPDEPAVSYARRLEPHRQREGVFVDLEAADLSSYIAKPGKAEPVRYFDWPNSDKGRSLGLLLEFDPPLVALPATVRPDRKAQFRSDVRVFDRWGHPLRTGTVTRAVRVEGHENVVADGALIESCLRLALDTRIRLRWGPWLNVRETLWLRRGIGEVKRVRRIEVLAFLLYFREAHAFELAADQSAAVRGRDYRPRQTAAYGRMAIFLDRFLPRLRVGGVVIEFARPDTGPAADRATDP